jgi:hypothetical protein
LPRYQYCEGSSRRCQYRRAFNIALTSWAGGGRSFLKISAPHS